MYQFAEKFVIMTREGGRCSEFMTFYDKGGREGKNLPFFYDIIFEWPLSLITQFERENDNFASIFK